MENHKNKNSAFNGDDSAELGFNTNEISASVSSSDADVCLVADYSAINTEGASLLLSEVDGNKSAKQIESINMSKEIDNNTVGTDSSIGGNQSNDVVASLASASDSSTSIQHGRILIASKVAIDEMPSVACSDKQVDSGSFSVPVGGAWVRVALYADDSGSVVFTNVADDSVHAVVRSSLEEGEWPNADNADYFSVVREVFFPQGDYRFVCKVNNIDMAPHNSQNRTYFRYALSMLPLGEQEEPCNHCPCDCEDYAGDEFGLGAVFMPTDPELELCSDHAVFDCVDDAAVAVSGDGVPSRQYGLRLRSAWNWSAGYEAESDSVSLRSARGNKMFFKSSAASPSEASASGSTSTARYKVQFLDGNMQAASSGATASHFMLKSASGQRMVFDASSGQMSSTVSAFGKSVSRSAYHAGVKRQTNASGLITSAYSAAQGLMRATNEGQRTSISWFGKSQVSVVAPANSDEEETYSTTGEPYKTLVFEVSEDVKSGTKTTTITQQQTGLPAHVTTRVDEGNRIVIRKGSGDEEIIRTITKQMLDATTLEIIESVQGVNDKAPLSCVRTLKRLTDLGWQLISRTEGYGTDLAQTTSFEYNEQGFLARQILPSGQITEYEYDADGRTVRMEEPWGADGKKVTLFTYANQQFYDNRVATEKEILVQGETELEYRTTTNVYEDLEAIERVTTQVTCAGSDQVQVSVTETNTDAAEYAYTRGRVKFERAVNGVETHYTYAATTEHGAAHVETITTMVNAELVSAQSHQTKRFIAVDGTLAFEQDSVWNGSEWLLLSSSAYEYDDDGRVTKTTQGNGRFATTTWMCCGQLSSTDEDGITTSFGYDSAHRLVEEIRSAVMDGETTITPETITSYTRDALGRAIQTRRDVGAMTTLESVAYDALGRQTYRVDMLGRVTSWAYSADGLTTTETLPSGATRVTVHGVDGNVIFTGGTAQRALSYSEEIAGNCLRRKTLLAGTQTVLYQQDINGFGQEVCAAVPSMSGMVYTHNVYNALGQLVKSYQDIGTDSIPSASTFYEYDGFGNMVKQTLALEEEPTPLNSPVHEFAFGVEMLADGVYLVQSQIRYNAAGQALTSVQKQLASALSGTLEAKQISINERGLVTTQWTEYLNGAKRKQLLQVPNSNIVAESVMVDGQMLSQTDNQGIIQTMSRAYTAHGMVLSQTDGRGNTQTVTTDIARRTVSATDAAGNVTTTAYCTCCDSPAVITDAQGNTAMYKYDIRGRKVAEWGSGIQPACFAYDEADRLVSLTTFRAGTEIINTDPSDRTDGDVTSWLFDLATGLELRKTYADGSFVTKTYDAFNRLATETDARGVVKTHSYEPARGLLLGTSYSDGTSPRSYSYNHLGQVTQVIDDAGIRSIGYNAYSEVETDSLLAGNVTHLITEMRDEMGRSVGYTYAKNGSVQQSVSMGYDVDGRIATAGFVHGGAVKQFVYSYMPGSNLLQTLTMPNNMSLTQSFEEKRDLLTQMDYKRGATLVTRRQYTYDTLARPLTRQTSRQGQTINDSFVHNSRSELSSAQVNGETFGYDYDNIGNRRMAMESSDYAIYEANNLNQYSSIRRNEEEAFVPTFDADGNQTFVRTATGIWSLTYNAENRPVQFQKTTDSITTRITCTYDSMGRRATKKVEEITTDTEGNEVTAVISDHRFIYRGYLQIACCDLSRSGHPCLWLITWDPTQPVATRPLAIQKDGTWFCYGWDLTKNICEVFGPNGYIRTAYTYTPYGSVTANGDITQPIQWSSEYADVDLALVYYNYRHYNPMDGRWLGRDKVNTLNRYAYNASPFYHFDGLGLFIFSNIDLDKLEDVIRYEAKKAGRLLDQGLTEAKNIGKAIDRKTSPYVCKGKRMVKPHVKRLSDFGKPYVIGASNMVKPYVDEAIQLVDSASVFADPYLQQMMGYWNYFKATEFAQSWNWAATHLYNWILGNLPSESTYYADKDIEARYMRDGIAGQSLRYNFYKKNKDARYCNEWKSYVEFAAKFPGWKSFTNFPDFKLHFSRLLKALPNGVESYVASVSGEVLVSFIGKINGQYYVEAEFRLWNNTNTESFFYHITGNKERGVMKNWKQTFIWVEKIPCQC